MPKHRGSILTIACVLAASSGCGRIGTDASSDNAAIDAAAEFTDASQDWWDETWLGRTELRVDNSGIAEDLLRSMNGSMVLFP